MGYTDLSWRKGTATVGNTADQGRDIEATITRQKNALTIKVVANNGVQRTADPRRVNRP